MLRKFFIFGCLLFASMAFAQLSISVDNKYGFKMPGSYGQFGGYGNSTTNTTTTTYESKKFCFGNGYQGGITLRYGIKNGINIDLGYAYLLGSESVTVSKNTWNNSSTTYSIKARFSRILLGFSYIGDEKISPYFKMGILTSIGYITSNSSSSSSYQNPYPPYNTQTNYTEREFKYYGGMSIGFYSAMGLAFALTEKLKLSISLDILFDDYSPDRGKLTAYTINEIDQLPTMTTHDKEVDFMKNYSESGATNPSTAAQSSKISIPISSFGPTFIIHYSLGKKESPKDIGNE